LENKGASKEEKRKVLQEVSKLANASTIEVNMNLQMHFFLT